MAIEGMAAALLDEVRPLSLELPKRTKVELLGYSSSFLSPNAMYSKFMLCKSEPIFELELLPA